MTSARGAAAAKAKESARGAAKPVSGYMKAAAVGLGALAIGEGARQTYNSLQRKQGAQQAARRAERDHRVARARALRDLSHAQQADEFATARRMHRIPTPLSQFDIREPYTEAEILTRIATRERPHIREAATLLLNNQEL